jgi:hypothetical protein
MDDGIKVPQVIDRDIPNIFADRRNLSDSFAKRASAK